MQPLLLSFPLLQDPPDIMAAITAGLRDQGDQIFPVLSQKVLSLASSETCALLSNSLALCSLPDYFNNFLDKARRREVTLPPELFLFLLNASFIHSCLTHSFIYASLCGPACPPPCDPLMSLLLQHLVCKSPLALNRPTTPPDQYAKHPSPLAYLVQGIYSEAKALY